MSNSSKQRDIILHAHIFKNAGTTFDLILRNNFGQGFLDFRDDPKLMEGGQQYLEDYLRENPQVRAFSCHSVHFVAANTPEFSFHQVYFLRHPVVRIRSIYDFSVRQPAEQSVTARLAKEMTFEEFVLELLKEGAYPSIKDYQMHYISGLGINTPVAIDEKYQRALEHVRTLPLIGVVDRFEESCEYFKKQLATVFPGLEVTVPPQNQSGPVTRTTEEEKAGQILKAFSPAVQDRIIENNQRDMALYQLANKRLSGLQ